VRFFPRVIRERVRTGLIGGIVAAAATAGVLLGFGIARGSAWRPINTVAHLVLGYRAEITDGLDAVVTPIGIAVHTLSLLLWGVLFALLAGGVRGWRLLIAALAFGGAAFLIDHRFLPIRFKPGFELVLTWPELAALYAVLALALAFGISLARSRHAA
jgi:hypothetical protein